MNGLDQFKEETAFRLFGRSRMLAIAGNQCVKCGKPANSFKDELSKKEYGISGFCQSCQDDIFGPSDDCKDEVLGITHEMLGEEE